MSATEAPTHHVENDAEPQLVTAGRLLAKMGEHFASNPYLTFQDVTPEGRLTRIVEVIAVRSGALLGTIRWYGPWRQYVFAPEQECVFNVGCLTTVNTNVQVMNDIRKGRL